jgi:hypothetical protein
MSDLSVEVLSNGILVTKPGTVLAVTYRRNWVSKCLEAHEILERRELDPAEVPFLAAAWKAAYSKAKELAWL